MKRITVSFECAPDVAKILSAFYNLLMFSDVPEESRETHFVPLHPDTLELAGEVLEVLCEAGDLGLGEAIFDADPESAKAHSERVVWQNLSNYVLAMRREAQAADWTRIAHTFDGQPRFTD